MFMLFAEKTKSARVSLQQSAARAKQEATALLKAQKEQEEADRRRRADELKLQKQKEEGESLRKFLEDDASKNPQSTQ